MDAFEFVKNLISHNFDSMLNQSTKFKKVIEVNKNSVLHCRTNALCCVMKVIIFSYGCVQIVIILGFSQL